MAKVEIKKKDGKKGLIISDYDILTDGIELTMITGITIDMEIDDINRGTLYFNVDELKIDADALLLLQGKVR